MKPLIILTMASLLSAKTLWIVNTDDYLGRCVFECGDVIIKPHNIELKSPRCIKKVECNNFDCVEYTVNRYKHLYRTQGIGVEEIK